MDTRRKQRRRVPGTDGFTGCLVVGLLFVGFFIGGMLGGMLGSGLTWWALSPAGFGQAGASLPATPPLPSPTPLPTPTATPSPTPEPTPSPEQAIEAVVASVVTVINERSDPFSLIPSEERRVKGSGIVVDGRGYVLTNYHVVAGSDGLSVILASGRQISATLVAGHRTQDLALLRVYQDDLPAIRWGTSSDLHLGQMVMAIGVALGDFPNSVTFGVVSGLDRALELEDFVIEGLIQTDAAINQGNSGGPLVNRHGEVIGINTFMIREGRERSIAEGIAFAIPADVARELVEAWVREDLGLPPPGPGEPASTY